ncbi:MAG: D-alanyl-D-alanine carboxypeptidase [Micavibrio sp.]|nr:D-alanyl-D-alanine carboxypeptidase [Micavibrio sp.]
MRTALLTLLITSFIIFSSAAAFAKGNPRYASIIMDAQSGVILEEQRADKPLHPASLTKIMTLMMLFDAVNSGKLSLNSRIPMTTYAASKPPSKIGLKPGETIKVKDAIGTLVTKSANDIATAVGDYLGGSEKGFARMMNRKAIQIGMTRTTFVNASGLHHPRQISTARDMAKLARYIILNYPKEYRYFSMTNFNYNGKNYHNHNRLLGKYAGMDGIKTGYVNASGFNLVASAVKGNRRIIAVVFGGRTSQTRNAHMEVLLDRGFKKMGQVRIASTPAPTTTVANLTLIEPPIPGRKPAVLGAIAAITNASEQGGQKLAALSPSVNDNFKSLLGEGDSDPSEVLRVQAGLSAISSYSQVKGFGTHVPVLETSNDHTQKSADQMPAHMRQNTSSSRLEPWSVQIGAFNSRAATDKAIHNTLRTLPAPFSSAQPLVAPLQTQQGWLFRARLSGFSKDEAYAVCKHISECLPIAPRN